MCSLQGLGVFPLFSVHISLVLESSATHILSQGGAAPFQSYSNPHLPPACLPALDSRERLELSCASSKNGSHGSPQEPLSRAIFLPLSRRAGEGFLRRRHCCCSIRGGGSRRSSQQHPTKDNGKHHPCLASPTPRNSNKT